MNPTIQVLDSPELVWNLLLQADYDTILNYCWVNKQAQEICQDAVFWMQKAQYDFGIPFDIFKVSKLSAVQRYLQLKYGINTNSVEVMSPNEFMKAAIQQDRPDLVQYVISLGFDYWPLAAYEYAKKGNQEAVDYYLQLSKNYPIQNAAQGALEGGNKELFDYLYSKYPNYNWRYEYLGVAAIKSGQPSLFYYILSLVSRSGNRIGLDEISEAAIKSKNETLVKYIVSLAPNYSWNFNFLAFDALRSGNKNLFDYIYSLAPSGYRWAFNSLAGIAIEMNNRQLFDYFQSLVPPNYEWPYWTLANSAVKSGNQQLLDYILSLAPNYNWDYNVLAGLALKSGNKKFFDYIRSLPPSGYGWDYNSLAENVISSEIQEPLKRQLFDYVLSLPLPVYPWDFNMLAEAAVKSENKRMLDYIFSLAPLNYPWDFILLAETAEDFHNMYLYNYIRSLTPKA